MRAVGLVEVLTALGALFKKRTGAFVAGFSFCLAEQRDPAGLVCRFNGQGFNRKGRADGLWSRRLFAAGEKRERQKAGADKTECMSHVVEGGLFLACVSVWPRSRREANVFG